MSTLFFGQALDKMGQKCPYLAKNVSFGPKIHFFGGEGVKLLVSSYQGTNETPFSLGTPKSDYVICARPLIRLTPINRCSIFRYLYRYSFRYIDKSPTPMQGGGSKKKPIDVCNEKYQNYQYQNHFKTI